MADRNKFEEMLERLINEDKEGAEELFHEIVVEKSRDIYEGLLENDLEEVADEEVDETTDEEVDEATDEDKDEDEDESEDDKEVDEGFDLDEFEVEADDAPEMGGDPADAMMGDVEVDGDDEEEGEEGEEGDVEDRVEDLEDALDDLKAEFEKMMAGDEGEGDDAEGDMEAGDEEDGESEEESFDFGEAEEDKDEAVEEATDDEEVEESKQPQTAGEQMREYVEKVTAKMGDNGANAKSPVAGANDMGGDAGNLVQGSEENGGKAESAKDETAGNVNVPGGKASKSMKAEPKGHGAEKKGAGEAADNKKSVVGK